MMSGEERAPIAACAAGTKASRPCIGRLAPSPTGALHLGNARSFLLAWLSVRQQAGQLLLRIEDIDSPRVKPWAVQATIDDLLWLGLDWDAGPGKATSSNNPRDRIATSKENLAISYVQTKRLDRYRQVLQQLRDDGRIYICTCTRSEVAEAASAPHEHSNSAETLQSPEQVHPTTAPLDGLVYPGICRSRFSIHPGNCDKFAWRWAFKPGAMDWCDSSLGPQTTEPLQTLGDFVIARSNDMPAYQLAVVVDDYDMQVNEVVRGDDLVYSTYRQLAILRHLGWPEPDYVHVPLVVGPDGRRLAKRHGDTRLKEFRRLGITPQAIVGYLAWTARLIPEPLPTTPQQLVGKLVWSKLPRTATVFDLDRDLPMLRQLSNQLAT